MAAFKLKLGAFSLRLIQAAVMREESYRQMCCFAVAAQCIGVKLDHPRAVRENQVICIAQALEQGRVLPLRTVLEKIERDYQGQALKVEFEQDDGRFLYKIRLLQSDGRMVKLKVDAVDGRVLETKRKEREKDRDAHPRR